MKKFNVYFRAIMNTGCFALVYFMMYIMLIDTINEYYWFVVPVLSAVFAFIFFSMFLITVMLHFYSVKLRFDFNRLMQEKKSLEECVIEIKEKMAMLEKNNNITEI